MSLFTPEQARQSLIERHRQLLTRWRGAVDQENELLDYREPDWEDLAAVQRDARVLDSLGDSEVEALNRIIGALRRIAENTYGRCLECGDEIATERLRAVPETAYCSSCAELLEKPLPPPPGVPE